MAQPVAFQDVYDFLVGEAALLDARRFRDWLALVSQDIDYRIPIHITRSLGSDLPAFSTESFHMMEDPASLTTRIDRFDTGYAWSQDPPPMLRRFVSNIRITGQDDNRIEAVSYILLHYARADEQAQYLAGERHDLIRQTSDGLRLARRTVYLDHTYLPTENLASFL